MNWPAVISALEETSHGAELVARTASDEARRQEARIVSGVAAVLANALRQGIEP